jgi:hypothetical protein
VPVVQAAVEQDLQLPLELTEQLTLAVVAAAEKT